MQDSGDRSGDAFSNPLFVYGRYRHDFHGGIGDK
jgi:hypothetical protein